MPKFKKESQHRPSPDTVWLALNKPAEAVTSRRDPEGRRTVYDFLPPGLQRVEAVGRLDRPTTGLLLFTDDFKLSQALLDPELGLARVYQVVTDAPLPGQAAAAASRGVLLDDGTFFGAAKILPVAVPAAGRSYHFTLHEGKNREVRRLVEHFGRKVRGLHRLSFGPIRLGGLKSGQVRTLQPDEIAGLQRSAKLPGRQRPGKKG